MDDLDLLYEDKTLHDLIQSDKVLCIFEGKDELSFVKKVHELFSQPITCEDFISNKIELSWGKEPIFWKNINSCNFQGGSLSGCPVPMPVLESLNANDLESYKAILVMFDGDCDELNYVESHTHSLLQTYNSFVFVSDVCFEKVAIELIENDETTVYIDEHYIVIDESQCKWYKNNYGNIPKSSYFRRVQSLEKAIKILRQEDIEKNNLSLNNCVDFIKESI